MTPMIGGNKHRYYIKGLNTQRWLHVEGGGQDAYGAASPAGSAPPADATALQVIPVHAEGWSWDSPRCLAYNVSFYLRTADGKYVERLNRISSETPSQAPHYSARFGLSAVNQPTQSWTVSQTNHPLSPFVEQYENEGIQIVGNNTNWQAPNNNIARMLTLRSDVSVVVWWWDTDEHLAFIPA